MHGNTIIDGGEEFKIAVAWQFFKKKSEIQIHNCVIAQVIANSYMLVTDFSTLCDCVVYWTESLPLDNAFSVSHFLTPAPFQSSSMHICTLTVVTVVWTSGNIAPLQLFASCRHISHLCHRPSAEYFSAQDLLALNTAACRITQILRPKLYMAWFICNILWNWSVWSQKGMTMMMHALVSIFSGLTSKYIVLFFLHK